MCLVTVTAALTVCSMLENELLQLSLHRQIDMLFSQDGKVTHCLLETFSQEVLNKHLSERMKE